MRTFFSLLLTSLSALAGDYSPDPASVRRHGSAYRYPQDGWIVLHIEGKPYERGVQHGTLMATEIAAYARCFAAQLSSKDPAGAWTQTRRLTGALFQRKFDKEYLEEMKGIADGAAEAGATIDGRAIDLTDIVVLNCWAEIESIDGGLEALPTGLEGLRPKTPKPKTMPAAKAEHCSAFAATGPATADGKVVFGHITMFGLYPSRFYNIWLDVQPDKGHRVLMQSYPGGIQSGMDYYLNSAGICVCETTIDQTRFNADGIPLTNRIRKALQYGKSIDDVVKVLSDGNNGLYTNEWLIADTNTNEIAMFELGTKATKLWRSSKDEWFAGTKGFYWGCNNTKDLDVRLDTIADLHDRPRSTTWIPSARDKKWLQFYEKYKGKITGETGKLAFSTPPICGRSSLDAKVTTTELVKDLRTHAIFGPPIGGTWQLDDDDKSTYPEIVPLVPNDWTVLHPKGPSKGTVAKVADLPEKAQAFVAFGDRTPSSLPNMKPAWHGTLLPKSDADLWLTEGFAAYERLVAFEMHLRKERDEAKLTDEDQERLAIELNLHRSRINDIQPGPAVRDRFVRSEIGIGVFRLDALRKSISNERFVDLMERFGREYAGKKVTGDDFTSFVEKNRQKNHSNDPLRDPVDSKDWPRYSVRSWMEDLENTVIVFGSKANEVANRETATMLQKAIANRGSNVIVPIASDAEATKSPEQVIDKHVLLIGGPGTNQLTDRWQEMFRVKFASGSFRVREETYAHPGSAVIAAGPLKHDVSATVIAGLSAESTQFAIRFMLDGNIRGGNVLVIPNQARARSLLVK